MKIPEGFLLSGIHAGIKKKKLDLGIIYCEDFATAVGFFTKNANPAYSVTVSKENINNKVKALVCNSGNANCFSHTTGISDTKKICSSLAKVLNVKAKNILIASTGIIGKVLPFKKLISKLPKTLNSLGDNPQDFAESILTTDTCVKISSRTMNLKGKEINILGIAKGAGMIKPNMATMLSFIMTDANLSKKDLKAIAKEAVEKSFNCITIDGCMSTNDSVYVLSSGVSAKIESNQKIDEFSQLLSEVCLDLAKMIVQDAEGATKFVSLTVQGAKSALEAKKACEFIANSDLFKTAIYGENANWGRIVAALGDAGIAVKENVFKVRTSSLKKEEVEINITIGKGLFENTVYTSDLTPGYVKINAGYS